MQLGSIPVSSPSCPPMLGALKSRRVNPTNAYTHTRVSTSQNKATSGDIGKARQHDESRFQVGQEHEKLKCFVCGEETATQSCDRCALKSFCQQCFNMWHSHPDRRSHKQRHHNLKRVEVSRCYNYCSNILEIA